MDKLLAWLLPAKLQAAAAAAITALVVAAIAYPLGQCSGQAAGARHERERQAEAARKAEKRNDKAISRSDVQRQKDQARTETAQKERTDAIHAGGDEAPSGPELRLACQRLRQQHTPESRLPLACRPDSPR